jgi:insulysin
MLESALDQFSKYFTDLLIKPEKIEQEVNYIDKEFSKALDNINWQIEFLLRQMSNPASLYSRFSLGNSQSILENTKKQNIDLDSELSDFYASLYSANLMSLVVKGRQSLEILEDWVKNKFTFVKDNKLILPSFARTSKAFSLDKLGKIVWLKNK